MIYRRPFPRRQPRSNRPLPPAISLPQPDTQPCQVGPVPMNALTLIYHEDLEPEITGIIQRKMIVARYTRVRDVIGARGDNMADMDIVTEGKNHMLIVVATNEIISELADALRTLREKKGHGLRGYITPVEGLI